MANTVLEKVPYFKKLNKEILDYIEKNSNIKDVPKGKYLFHADEKCKKLYIIKEGLIKVFMTAEDGKEIILHYMGEGRFLGDTILFNEDRYGSNACAVKDSKLIVIENRTLEHIIVRYPEIGIYMLADFGSRLKRMMKLTGEMALSDVKKRIIRLLVELAMEVGIKENGSVVLQTIPNQEEMASMIGTAREVYCRELHKLENEELLTLDKRQIVIHDIGKLRKMIYEKDEVIFPLRNFR